MAPLILVLNVSILLDAAGATVMVSLLTPPPSRRSKARAWFKSHMLSSEAAAKTCPPPPPDSSPSSPTPLFTGGGHLQELLEGPFAELTLGSIEARVAPEHVAAAASWVEECYAQAYVSPLTGRSIRPGRSMLVLVNPNAGRGRAERIWAQEIRPILEAAECRLEVVLTRHRNHGLEIVHHEPNLAERYDCIMYLSGDGLMHEVLNGIASRADARTVLDKVAVVPVPAGSGNACSVNLLGPSQGFNFAQAALNAVKGHWFDLEICTITQPVECLNQHSHLNSMLELMKARSGAGDVCQTSQDEETGFVRYYSFLSQTTGLMADLDIGTEHLRALGDLRFILGYLNGVLWNIEAHVTLDIKLGTHGTTNRADMRQRVMEHQAAAATRDVGPDCQGLPPTDSTGWEASLSQDAAEQTPTRRGGEGMPDLQSGSAIDDLGGEALPDFDLYDPSWPKSQILQGDRSQLPARNGGGKAAAPGWARVRRPLMSMYAGKLPYVARDLLQFPCAIAGDNLVDLAFMVQDTRYSKLRALMGAESGAVVYDEAISYVKAEAFRVTPQLPAGSPQLCKGGIISIDGERVPYAPFQVEITKDTQLHTYSVYGNFVMKHHWPAS